MNRIKLLLYKDTNDIFLKTKNLTCKKVVIKHQYSIEWKTSKNQILIDISTNEMKDKEIEFLNKKLEEYQDKYILNEFVSPITFQLKYFDDSHILHFVVFFQSPLTLNIKEYFKEVKMGKIEKEIYLNQLCLLFSSVKKNELLNQMIIDWNEYTFGLFMLSYSVFPVIQLTPLAFIISILNKMNGNNSLIHSSIKQKKSFGNENEKIIVDKSNGYNSDEESNVFSSHLSNSNSSEEYQIEGKEKNKDKTERIERTEKIDKFENKEMKENKVHKENNNNCNIKWKH